MRAMVPTTSAIRNAPHSVRTATGRAEPSRRIGGARHSGADIPNRPLTERAAGNMVPTMVDRSETLNLNILDRVKAAPSPWLDHRSRLRARYRRCRGVGLGTRVFQ